MRRRISYKTAFSHLCAATRGSVATWFALASTALLLFAGVGLDIGRSVNQKQQIQGAVDAAALAGASAYTDATQAAAAKAVADNYMATFKSTSGLTSLTFNSTPSTKSASGLTSAYVMTVTASATIDNSLAKAARATNTINVTAVAQSAAYKASVSLNNWSSNAVDTDTISWYTVPADGSPPTVTVPLFSNAVGAPTSTGTVPIPVAGTQRIGFMLTNVTDGNATPSVCTGFLIFRTCTKSNDYGSNQYGGAAGIQHLFYSHMMPPSKVAYPGVTQNCSLQVLVGGTSSPATGCTSGLPTNGTFNCAQISGMTLRFFWNDMGGATDDKDYDDAVYTVTCSKVDSTVPQGVVLTN
jgi:Flp pilus assembly protein TadG